MAHVEFYQQQVLFYQNPANYKMWRSLLYKELDTWYKDHPPSSKKRRSYGSSSGSPSVVVRREFLNVDNFVDLLDDATGAGGASAGAPAAGVALAAAASAAAAASTAAAASGTA